MKGIYQQMREGEKTLPTMNDEEIIKAFNELINDIKEGKIYKDGRFQKI